jgi:peptide/nickel transport system substrate-binding protein
VKISRIFILLLVVFSLLFASGIGLAQGKFGGTLEVANPYTIVTLDWQGTTDSSLRQLGWHIWEGLTCYDENFEIIPQLAKSIDVNDDNTEYTFHLREGVNFQRGYGELTAVDVKASLDRFFTEGVRVDDFKNVESVEVIDDYTVKVNLYHPSGVFLPLLSTPLGFAAIMPEEIAQIPVRELDIEQIVGTGPYQLEKWTPGEIAVLKKFEDYTPDDSYNGPRGMGGYKTAYFDTVNLNVVTDETTRASGLRTGQYDYVLSPPIMEFETFKADERFGIMDKSTLIKPAYSFNITKAPTDSIAFRRAVLEALNMSEIMSSMMMGVEDIYRLDSSFFAKEGPWWFPAGEIAGVYNKNHQDLEEAARLLEIAGYQGEELLLIASSAEREAAGLVMQQQLKQAGINVKLEVYDWATAVNRREEGQWHIFMGGASQSPFDPSSMRLFYYGETAQNLWNYSNEILDAMIDVQAEWDTDSRIEAYKQIQLLLWNDLPFFIPGDHFYWNAYTSNLHGPCLENWYLVRFWDIWRE